MAYEAGYRRSLGLASRHPRSGALLLHAFGALLACGGQRMVVGEELPGADPNDARGEGTGDGRPSGISVVAECPSSPEERQVRLGCWPTRHVGRWRGFLLGNPVYETLRGEIMEFPLTDIVLSVEPFGAARLSFGEPAPFLPPAGPGDAYLCAGRSPSVGCPAAESIIVGYEYALEDLELFDASVAATAHMTDEFAPRIGEQLSFDVPLDAPWRLWCELQEPERGPCPVEQYGAAALGCQSASTAPDSLDDETCQVTEGEVTRSVDCGWLAARESAPCSCNEDGCSILHATLAMTLRLSNDGRALRGSVLTPLGTELGHLEFLRESP
jgi:hypothetical protein